VRQTSDDQQGAVRDWRWAEGGWRRSAPQAGRLPRPGRLAGGRRGRSILVPAGCSMPSGAERADGLLSWWSLLSGARWRPRWVRTLQITEQVAEFLWLELLQQIFGHERDRRLFDAFDIVVGNPRPFVVGSPERKTCGILLGNQTGE